MYPIAQVFPKWGWGALRGGAAGQIIFSDLCVRRENCIDLLGSETTALA